MLSSSMCPAWEIIIVRIVRIIGHRRRRTPPLPPYPRQGEDLHEASGRKRRPGMCGGGRPRVRGQGRRGMAGERPAAAGAVEEALILREKSFIVVEGQAGTGGTWT